MLNTISIRHMGEKLSLTNKFTRDDISSHIQLARYISITIPLRYGTLGPNTFSSYLYSLKGSLSRSSDWMIIGVLNVLYPYKITLIFLGIRKLVNKNFIF